MKKLLLSFLAASSLSAVAAPVSFDFNKADLSSVLNATYGEILKRNIVQSPELVAKGLKVTLRIGMDDSKLPAFLSRYLDSIGVQSRDVDGVVYLGLKGSALTSLDQPLPYAASSSPATLSAPLPSSVLSPSSLNASPVVPSPNLLEKKNVEIFSPRYRRPDFLCGVLNALVGQGACSVSGTDCLLRLDDVAGPKVMELLPRLDKALPRLEVTATFLEFTNTGKDSIGLSVISSNLVKNSTLGLNLGTQVTTGALSIKGADFSLILDAIKTDTRFKQVSSPSGFLNSGESMSIVIGDEVPTLGNVQQDNKGNSVQSVVYRNSGVSLEVTPHVLVSESLTRIEAKIKGSVSSFSSTSTGVNNSPTLSKREVSTVVSLDDSEVVILGGLSGSRDSKSNSALFGVIPWGYNNDNSKNEILLMLTVKVSK